MLSREGAGASPCGPRTATLVTPDSVGTTHVLLRGKHASALCHSRAAGCSRHSVRRTHHHSGRQWIQRGTIWFRELWRPRSHHCRVGRAGDKPLPALHLEAPGLNPLIGADHATPFADRHHSPGPRSFHYFSRRQLQVQGRSAEGRRPQGLSRGGACGPHLGRRSLDSRRCRAPRGGDEAPRLTSVTYHRIYRVVRQIPRGRVATYGQVAALAGLQAHARQVGDALHALPSGSTVPWHRVVNARGAVSLRSMPGAELVQQQLLAREGLRLDGNGRVPLSRVRWLPRTGARGQLVLR